MCVQVCVSVYGCVCMSIYVGGYGYLCVYVCRYICMYVKRCMCGGVCMWVWVSHVCLCVRGMHVCVYGCMCLSLCV